MADQTLSLGEVVLLVGVFVFSIACLAKPVQLLRFILSFGVWLQQKTEYRLSDRIQKLLICLKETPEKAKELEPRLFFSMELMACVCLFVVIFTLCGVFNVFELNR